MNITNEEAPTNSVGSGEIAGVGVGPQGEPGVTPKKKKKYAEKNAEEAPNPIMSSMMQRKTFRQWMTGK